MSIFLRIAGIVFIIAAIVIMIAFLSLDSPLIAMLFLLLTVSVGLALFAVADVRDRMDFLEEQLGFSLPETDENLTQTICPDCGREHDFDYPKCPYCGRTED